MFVIVTPVPNKKKPIICILGMHRSGTSMLARVLNICGVNLGYPQEMFTSTYGNEKGHWENIRFMEINIQIIKLFSTEPEEWNAKPSFPDKWLKDKRLKNLKIKAKKLILELDLRYEIWGWKGPRNCITLPFWQEILGKRLLYIIVTRQPIDVAYSLLKRNNYPLTDGLLLWNRYVSDAVKFTTNLPRYFISSEQMFSNLDYEVNSLVKFINNKNVTSNKNIIKQIKAFVSPGIWHNQKYQPMRNSKQDEVTDLVTKLYFQALTEISNLYKNIIDEKESQINSQYHELSLIQK